MQLADGARLDTIPTRDKTLNNWQNGRKTLMNVYSDHRLHIIPGT
jgi:hypothetical protein